MYLRSLEPLTTSEELAKTRGLVERFLAPGGAAPSCSPALRRVRKPIKTRAGCKSGGTQGLTSTHREPGVVFVSHFFHFADLPHSSRRPDCARATALLHGALLFRQKIVLGEDLGRGNACHTLSVAHVQFLQGATARRDNSVIYPASDDANNHVVVICRHQFFFF